MKKTKTLSMIFTSTIIVSAGLAAFKLQGENQTYPEEAQGLEASAHQAGNTAPAATADVSADQSQEEAQKEKEIMRQAERVMLNAIYEDLFEELAFTSEEKQAFLSFFDGEKASKDFGEEAKKIMDTTHQPLSPDQIQQIQQIQQQQLMQQLKDLLGEERFAKYEEYVKTIGPRAEAKQAKEHFVKIKMPLQKPQLQQLTQVLKEELEIAEVSQSNILKSFEKTLGKGPEAFSDDDRLKMAPQFLQVDQEMYQRVVDRAKTFLTPEQQKELSSFYQNRVDDRKAGLKIRENLQKAAGPESKIQANSVVNPQPAGRPNPSHPNASLAKTVKDEARMVADAIDQYAIENNKLPNSAVNWVDITPYLKHGSALQQSGGKDSLGNEIWKDGDTVGKGVQVNPATKTKLLDATGGDAFWGPYS